MTKQILSSRHYFKEMNSTKKLELDSFIKEYRRVMSFILDDIWVIGYDDGFNHFDVKNNIFNISKYLDYNKFDIETFLTARVMSSLVTQLTALLKSSYRKQAKRIYQYNKMKSEGKSKRQMKYLIKALKRGIPQKPNVSNILPELSSKNTKYIESDFVEFDGFLILQSIVKNNKYGFKIPIPIKHHKHSNKLKEKGKMLNSFLINNDYVEFRWELKTPKLKTKGEVVGADQGLNTVLSISNEKSTIEIDNHNHSLNSIIKKMSNQKKGSKAFKRSQDHRKNFINMVLNKIDLSDIKQINLEKVEKLRYKQKNNKFLSHWTYPLIKTKVESLCELNGVRFKEQSSAFRSQRCSSCGLVLKSNRKGKKYKCKCGHEMDADINASKNHVPQLPEIPYELRVSGLNYKGFYWLESGLFNLQGESLESSLTTK